MNIRDTAQSANLPALCDEAIRDLGEARTIEDVEAIRDRTEALRQYAKKVGAAVSAKNTCVKIIKLCEARIGRELKEGKARGDVAKERQGVRTDLLGDPQQVRPLTLAELGISYDRSVDYQILGEAPEAVITGTVDRATAEGREVSKVEVDRAAGEAVGKRPRSAKSARGGRAPASSPTETRRKRGRPKSVENTVPVPNERPAHLNRFVLSLQSVIDLLPECGEPASFAALAERHRVFFDPSRLGQASQFLAALAAAVETDRAA